MTTLQTLLKDLRQLAALKGGGEVTIDADLLAVVLDSRAELLGTLAGLLAAAPAFRALPVGAPNSPARAKQDAHIEAEKAARLAIANAYGEKP